MKKPKWGGAREGSGPPRIIKDPVRLTAVVEKTQKRKLQRQAKREEISESEALRRILDKLP